MEFIYTNPHFDVKDINPIEEIVRDNDSFVLSPSSVDDKYDLMGYIVAVEHSGIELRALLDHNILIPVISLASGDPVPEDESLAKAYILSSAVMAFLIICRFEIEQRIAIDEQLSSSTHSQTKRALHLSLVANNIRVKEWIDIALGRKKNISSSEIDDSEAIVASANYGNDEANSRVIDAWKINYYFVLKAVEIWKSSNNNLNNACKYIHWMKEEWLFSHCPTIFAMIFFSPNRYPKMIKNINSHSKQKLIHGIQNAAWDLTYIRGWSNSYQSSSLDRLWLLCSNDIALRSITKMIFEGSEQSENPELEQLQEYWSASDAQRIFDVYNQVQADIANDKDKRQQMIKEKTALIDDSITDLEAKVFGT
jgi:hypothetical protein